MSKFDAVHPERTADALASGLKETVALIDRVKSSSLPEQAKYDIDHELQIKRAQFNNALAEALGLSLDATLAPEHEPDPRFAMFMGDPETPRVAIPGQSLGVKFHAAKSSPASVTFKNAWVEPAAWAARSDSKGAGGVADVKVNVRIPDDAKYSKPYFSRPDIEQSYYDIAEERYLNRPLSPYPVTGWAEWEYAGVPIRVGQVVQTVKRITGQGSVYEPLVIGPAIAVTISPRAGIVPLDAKSFPVSVEVLSNVKGPAQGTVRLDLPAGWKSEPPSAHFETAQDGQQQTVTFQVDPSNLSEKPYRITAVAEYGGKQYREGYATVGYQSLRPAYLYRDASYRTSGVDVKVAPGLKVAYITGSGDEVPASLEHLGVRVTYLSPS